MTERRRAIAGPYFRVALRLLATEAGGRRTPIVDDYRPSWDLGNRWLGAPTINDGRVVLEGDSLAPGAEGLAEIEPLACEHWGRVVLGAVIAMQEGSRVVGHATVLEVISPPAYWTPEVAVFVDQALQFCAFVERAGDHALEPRVVAARERLLELYQAGARLPRVEPPEGIAAGPTPARPEGWPGFGELDVYWEAFDPFESSEPVAGSLSDDLLDIYRDLRRGLGLWEQRGAADPVASRVAAIWEWRFHFDNHWGDHATSALRALHRACTRATGR